MSVSIYSLSFPTTETTSMHGNNCSLVLPILEYCSLNTFCKSSHSAFIGLSDSYHNIASPTKVKQNLCTFMLSRKSCVSIQSFVLSKWASASSSGLPANLGLKWDQFNCSLWGAPGAKGALGKNGLCGVGFFLGYYLGQHLGLD